MTTLAQMISRSRNALSDPDEETWSDALLEEWLRDAVRDYSRYIPRVLPENQNFISPPYNAFDPPFSFQAIVSMRHYTGTEYEFVVRKDWHSEEFQNGSGKFYHVRKRSAADESDRIELSFDVDDYPAEYIQFDYLSDHEWLLDSPDYILTVIERDEPILVQYVTWRAWLERSSLEARNPDSTTLLLSTHATNADKAERAYRRMINDAIKLQNTATSNTIHWKMDKWSS